MTQPFSNEDMLDSMTINQASQINVDNVIKELFVHRIAQGISIADIASVAGIGRATVTDAENGKHMPSFANVCKWAHACGFRITLTKIT